MKTRLLLLVMIGIATHTKTSHAQESKLVMSYGTSGEIQTKRVVPSSGVLGATPVFLYFPKQGDTLDLYIRNYGGRSFDWRIEATPDWVQLGVTAGSEQPDLSHSGGTRVPVRVGAYSGPSERRDSMRIVALDSSVYLSPTWVHIVQVPDTAVISVVDETESEVGTVTLSQYGGDQVELGAHGSLMLTSVGVYNVEGRQVLHQTFERSQEVRLDTSGLVSGVYFLLVRLNDNRVVLKKILIAR